MILHELDKSFFPLAAKESTGSGNLCLLTSTPIEEAKKTLQQDGVLIIEGIVDREGANGMLKSIYFRDPAGNSLEFAEPSIWGLDGAG